MNSTTSFESTTDPLVEVKHLHVSYEQDHYQKASLRDLCLNTAQEPPPLAAIWQALARFGAPPA